MKYFLQREGKSYGPYSFDDLKRYQAENRIGPNDVVRPEDSDSWIPWQQVLNPPAATPQQQAPAAFPPIPTAPQPSYQQSPQPSYQQPLQQPQSPAPSGWDAPQQSQPAQPAQPNPWENPPQQSSGFGSQPPAYGGQQQQGFGGQPQQQGFGGQPQPQGFGGQPQQDPFAGGFGGGQPQAYGGAPQQPQFGGGYGGGGGAAGPMPPDMQWYIVLLITVLCGFFGLYWIWKQASFVGQIDPNSKGKKFLIYGIAGILGGYVLILAGVALSAMAESAIFGIFSLLGPLVILGAYACIIIAIFDMRKSIHNYYTTVEPMGINLMTTEGAILTFFFSMYYFQYHFANIAARKKALGHQ